MVKSELIARLAERNPHLYQRDIERIVTTIFDEVSARLRTFPNGATAMAALANAPEQRPIGCTQVTEILATPGVMLVMALPPGFDLTTLYTAGILTGAAAPEAARTLIDLLSGERQAGLRTQCGFV